MAKPKPTVVHKSKPRFVINEIRGVCVFNEEDELRICELRASGKSIPTVEEQLGWPRELVLFVCRKHGLAPPVPKPKVVQTTRIIPPENALPALAKIPERLVPREKPNVLDHAREWLVQRPILNHKPPAMKDENGCFWLRREDGGWQRAALDQVMRETYRTAKRNGVTLVLPNANWCAD